MALVSTLYWVATNRCTNKCMHCDGVFGVGDKIKEVSIKKQIGLIKESEISFNSLKVLGGEPLLVIKRKHIKQLRPYFKCIDLLTNGILLKSNKWAFKAFNEIHLSVYGGKLVDKSIKRMRTTEHDKYWNEINGLLQKHENLYLSAPAMNLNLKEIPKLVKMGNDRKVVLTRYLGKKFNPADWKLRGMLDKLKGTKTVFKNACFGPYYEKPFLCPAGVERLCYNSYLKGITPCLFIDKILGEKLSFQTYKNSLTWRKEIQTKAYENNSCLKCKYLYECGAGCLAQHILHGRERFCQKNQTTSL